MLTAAGWRRGVCGRWLAPWRYDGARTTAALAILALVAFRTVFAGTHFPPRDELFARAGIMIGVCNDSALLATWSPSLLGQASSQVMVLVLSVLAIGILGFIFIFSVRYGKLWIQAIMSRADVSLMSLIRMHFTKVNPAVIVQAKVMAAQAGLSIDRETGISTRRLESHYLANGNVKNVIHAIIAAQRARIPLDFDQASAIDLAGRDVLDAVQTSVYPKVIDCPDPRRSGKNTLSAITRNGIELLVRARVTVRTNLEQLIGGATEDTIIARVGESIISSIGSASSHFEVLENPDMITRAVLSRGLDSQTAFEIVSIDIADIDVGENIGARLQTDQAEADTRVARATAERHLAEAIAQEQEMKALVASNRAALVLAEAEVPQAMADAFRAGRVTSNATVVTEA